MLSEKMIDAIRDMILQRVKSYDDEAPKKRVIARRNVLYDVIDYLCFVDDIDFETIEMIEELHLAMRFINNRIAILQQDCDARPKL